MGGARSGEGCGGPQEGVGRDIRTQVSDLLRSQVVRPGLRVPEAASGAGAAVPSRLGQGSTAIRQKGGRHQEGGGGGEVNHHPGRLAIPITGASSVPDGRQLRSWKRQRRTRAEPSTRTTTSCSSSAVEGQGGAAKAEEASCGRH